MKVEVVTDNVIEGGESLIHEVTEALEALSELVGDLTRVTVRLSDEAAARSGPHDIVCRIEARPEGLRPIEASHEAATTQEAYTGAIRTLRQRLRDDRDQRRHSKGAPSIRYAEAGEFPGGPR